jgi:hypothetical protein
MPHREVVGELFGTGRVGPTDVVASSPWLCATATAHPTRVEWAMSHDGRLDGGADAMESWDEFTWGKAMQRAYEAVSVSERLYDDIDTLRAARTPTSKSTCAEQR